MLLLLLLTLGIVSTWGQTEITSLSSIGTTGDYIITDDIDASSFSTSIESFSGTLEAAIDPTTKMPYRIKNLSAPLFTTLTGTVKNIVIEGVNISNHTGNTGAIACTANGAARIYNCGILPLTETDSEGQSTIKCSVGGTAYTGGLVGKLDGTARVVNCYSYADITSGTDVGGIVGYNSGTTKAGSINTMVMNCMFYGDIKGGNKYSPVYGGNNIANLRDDNDRDNDGLNTFNYYAYDKAISFKGYASNKKAYNSALAVEDKYLNRFEFYRLLLNSNKKLAAFYVTGSVDDDSQMLKWVLETADRTIESPKPYPILKVRGYYPSIINPDFKNAPDSSATCINKGGKLPSSRGTLSVTISSAKTDGGQTWPTGATITQTTSLPLIRTDKDFDRFNFNYDKVQLPYYDEVGTGNYTENRVVTGWKITAITPIANDPYSSTNYPTTGIKDYPDHNYANRYSSNKDLYTVSKRVFSQGAYFDVPYGVTSITIEPYWAKAAYIADPNYDVVYKKDFSSKQNVTQTGTQVTTTGNNRTRFNGQTVETSVSNALTYINNTIANGGLGGYGPTVYDNAVVLVGNLHLDGVPSNGANPFTLMSVDEDNDHEPDYSLIYHHKQRLNVSPIRFDFLNVPGTSQAQRPNSASLACNVSIFKTKGWFEITNTALLYFSQFEYENTGNSDNNNNSGKVDGPLILLGGVFDQFVSTQRDAVNGKVIYIHVGGNVWFHEFGLGTHSDGSYSTPHVPVSVTGGDYDGFYLTGTYNQDAGEREDKAECYISSGRFKEVAGASQEPINGDVRWQIYNADIDNFYGGGINAAKPIKGDVTTDIFYSHVTNYYGGPKFGDMQSGKKVTTNATGCVFNDFFGAGYGGTSFSRKKYYDKEKYDFGLWQNDFYKAADKTGDRGKYYDGETTPAVTASYGNKGVGVAADFDYEFFIWSKGNTGGRFFVKFASFSLAQCNDVESTLKKCIINHNFYGGGSLGKVVGDAKSVLEDCIVKGNVFGAGFSAELPDIQVRDAGFAKDANNNFLLPNFNSSSGMFEPGTLSGTTTFTWRNISDAEEDETTLVLTTDGKNIKNGTSGSNLTKHYLYTDIDLSTSNLGSVAGGVSLTLKGNTTVGTLEGEGNAQTLKDGTGNVFGGGDQSYVYNETTPDKASTTVNLQGNTLVRGNVFGGGNKGLVSGNTKVNIGEPKTTSGSGGDTGGGSGSGSGGGDSNP